MKLIPNFLIGLQALGDLNHVSHKIFPFKKKVPFNRKTCFIFNTFYPDKLLVPDFVLSEQHENIFEKTFIPEDAVKRAPSSEDQPANSRSPS